MYTYDATLFKPFKSTPNSTEKLNRDTSPKHVLKLVGSILKRNKLEGSPLKVTPAMEIIDGQHRLAAIKKINEMYPIDPLKIYYWIDENFIKSDISLYNTNQKSWCLKDYMHLYCKDGMDSYKYLKGYIVRYKVPFHSAYSIVCSLNPDTRCNMSDRYKKGLMSISPSEDRKLETYFRKMTEQINSCVSIIRPVNPVIKPSILWNRNWQGAFFLIYLNLGENILDEVVTIIGQNASRWINSASTKDCILFILSITNANKNLYKAIRGLIL